MSQLQSPPKLRSYVDHKIHTQTDLVLNSHPKTYVSHWPGLTDMWSKPRTKKTNSYVDHYAQAGDLNTM